MNPHPVDATRLDRNWQAIQAEIDAPPSPRLERLLHRFGIPSQLTRLVGATPALRRAWLVATVGLILVGLAATDRTEPRASLFVFLLLAPLVPVLGVALAFGPANDPAYEVGLAAPVSGLRLVLLRTFVVLLVSGAALAVATLATPEPTLWAFAWVLPSLALVSLTLALSTRIALRSASLAVTLGWIVAATLGRAGSEPLAAFQPGAQALAAIVALAGAAFIVRRKAAFDVLSERL